MDFIDIIKLERDFYAEQLDTYNKLISLIEQNPAITELENLKKTLDDNIQKYNTHRRNMEMEAKRKASGYAEQEDAATGIAGDIRRG